MTDFDAADDPYLWLEDVPGDEALRWVRARNAATAATVESDPAFAATKAAIREVLDSAEKIPDVGLVGEHYYNFWRDGTHERGLWRRTTPASYRTDEPVWETVLDLDALAEREGESWVWHGASVLRPKDGGPWRHALVDLSKGGSDADVTREFDLVELRFVPASEGGFERPEAKGALGWIDADTVYAVTDLGPGTVTSSGYPRTVRRWRRGTALFEAPVVFEGAADDVAVSGWHTHTPGFERDFMLRSTTFYTSELFLVEDAGTPAERLVRIEVPESAEAGVHREWLLIELRDDWALPGLTHPAGSLVTARLTDFLAGSRDLTVLFTPTPTASLDGATWTRHHLVVTVLDDVRSRLHVLTPPPEGGSGTWRRTELPGLPPLGTVSARAVDAVECDDVWLVSTDYLTPTTLSLLALGAGPEPGEPERLKANPAFFDAIGLTATQYFTTSADGTRVPYVVVGPREPAQAPVLLYGYGGFEVSLTPTYSGALGRAWLANGGVYVVANIRGGGEYGPAWHQAALRENRRRAFEDFAAVAQDLVRRGVATRDRLGAEGHSNGGLLTGNMLTGYPEIFGAVVVGVPLLDMKRYPHLLAGASWMAEYGDPDDPAQWEYIRTFSPYHRFDPSGEYPPVLFTTSTKDDRVHPGHARKLAAAMIAAGKDVTYYENVEGGHGGAATNEQAAHMAAVRYRFLWERLS